VKEKMFSLGLQDKKTLSKLRAAPATAAQLGPMPRRVPAGEARFHSPTLVLHMAAEAPQPIFTSRNLPLLWHAL